MKTYDFYTSENQIIKDLKANKIIIVPTDTVYGICAIANEYNEVRINDMKQSLQSKKLSIIFPSVDYLINHCNIPLKYKKIMKKTLPGYFTYIVNINGYLKKTLGYERFEIGARVTTNEYLQNIIKKTGPIIASSCNISGGPICRTAEDIKKHFHNHNINVYIDDTIPNQKPTSIIDLTDNEKIIR